MTALRDRPPTDHPCRIVERGKDRCCFNTLDSRYERGTTVGQVSGNRCASLFACRVWEPDVHHHRQPDDFGRGPEVAQRVTLDHGGCWPAADMCSTQVPLKEPHARLSRRPLRRRRQLLNGPQRHLLDVQQIGRQERVQLSLSEKLYGQKRAGAWMAMALFVRQPAVANRGLTSRNCEEIVKIGFTLDRIGPNS